MWRKQIIKDISLTIAKENAEPFSKNDSILLFKIRLLRACVTQITVRVAMTSTLVFKTFEIST